MSDEFGLGRIHIPDERDHNFPMAAVIPTAPTRTHRYWNAGWRGDQGVTSQCVAYSWFHVVEMMGRPGAPDRWDPDWVYREAQKIDQWPGESPSYEGTSVRAGADILRREGAIREYRHANSLDDIVTAVLEYGPVEMGTKWTEGMFRPETRYGFLYPTGRVVGGHAWVVSGVNVNAGVARMDNSWGMGWGDRGRANLTFDVLDELFRDDGDAVIAILA